MPGLALPSLRADAASPAVTGSESCSWPVAPQGARRGPPAPPRRTLAPRVCERRVFRAEQGPTSVVLPDLWAAFVRAFFQQLDGTSPVLAFLVTAFLLCLPNTLCFSSRFCPFLKKA